MNSHRLQLVGWVLFALSGVFFLIDAVESGDLTALGAAITWLLGVAAFIVSSRENPED